MVHTCLYSAGVWDWEHNSSWDWHRHGKCHELWPLQAIQPRQSQHDAGKSCVLCPVKVDLGQSSLMQLQRKEKGCQANNVAASIYLLITGHPLAGCLWGLEQPSTRPSHDAQCELCVYTNGSLPEGGNCGPNGHVLICALAHVRAIGQAPIFILWIFLWM